MKNQIEHQNKLLDEASTIFTKLQSDVQWLIDTIYKISPQTQKEKTEHNLRVTLDYIEKIIQKEYALTPINNTPTPQTNQVLPQATAAHLAAQRRTAKNRKKKDN